MTDTLDKAPQIYRVYKVASLPKRAGFKEANTVALAALKLDDIKTDWYNLVNPWTIIMASHKRCILGQIYGDFTDGLDEPGILDIHSDNGIHPFISDGFISTHFVKKAWRREIRARR